MIDRGIDGIVPVGGSHVPELRALIEQAGVPVITTYVSKAQCGIPAIGIDNQLRQYLLDLGDLRFGAIANVLPANDRSRARLDGVQKALADTGSSVEPSQIIFAHWPSGRADSKPPRSSSQTAWHDGAAQRLREKEITK